VPSDDSFLGGELNNPLNMPPHHVSRWSDRSLEQVARFFPLQLLQLHHDPLDEMHIAAAAQCLVQNGLLAVLGRKRTVLEPLVETLAFRAVSAPFRWIVQCGIRRSRWRMLGHSVTAVYAKPGT
jgi:hypothetical protein